MEADRLAKPLERVAKGKNKLADEIKSP